MIDELASGVPYASAAQIETAFGLSYTTTAIVLFVVPGAIAMVVEPVIFLLADRHPRALFLRIGMTVMAMSLAVAAFAPNAGVLAIAISVFWLANGAAVPLAQATLVDRNPDARGRTLARWTLLSTVGDFFVPFVIGGVAVVGYDWRGAHVVMAISIGVFAIALWRMDLPAGLGAGDGDEDSPGLLATLREALRDRVLVGWLLGVTLCDMLDEIFVVFATLHVRDQLGGGIEWQSAMLLVMTVGSGIGLVALERLLATRGERWMLVGCAIACAISVVAWVHAPSLWSSTVLIGFVGMFASPLYPLAAAPGVRAPARGIRLRARRAEPVRTALARAAVRGRLRRRSRRHLRRAARPDRATARPGRARRGHARRHRSYIASA